MPLVMPKGKKSRLTVASPENSEAEASPVFAVLVNKEGNLWHRPDVSQSRKPFWYNTLRFPVHCRVEAFAIILQNRSARCVVQTLHPRSQAVQPWHLPVSPESHPKSVAACEACGSSRTSPLGQFMAD